MSDIRRSIVYLVVALPVLIVAMSIMPHMCCLPVQLSPITLGVIIWAGLAIACLAAYAHKSMELVQSFIDNRYNTLVIAIVLFVFIPMWIVIAR